MMKIDVFFLSSSGSLLVAERWRKREQDIVLDTSDDGKAVSSFSKNSIPRNWSQARRT